MQEQPDYNRPPLWFSNADDAHGYLRKVQAAWPALTFIVGSMRHPFYRQMGLGIWCLNDQEWVVKYDKRDLLKLAEAYNVRSQAGRQDH